MMNEGQQPRQDSVSDSPPGVDRRLALGSILGFWLFYFLTNTLRSLLGWLGKNQLDMLERRAVVTCFGIVLVYLLYRILCRLEGRSTQILVGTAFVAAIPISLAYAALNFVAFYVISPVMAQHEELSHFANHYVASFLLIVDVALNWYFFVVAWAVFYIALSYAARVRHAERNEAAYRAEAKTAELRALRYQINPHFLFNTLNSLSSLILCRRYDESERMILNLANFFRSSLTSEPTDDITLADEIALQQLYLEIEKTRFPDRLAVKIDIPAELGDAAVPGFILQPLVENAIKYGVSRALRPVTIGIRAHTEADQLHLSVEDDGDRIEGTVPGTGVGLDNIRNRLAARFGARARCAVETGATRGFRVDLTMPLLRAAPMAGQ